MKTIHPFACSTSFSSYSNVICSLCLKCYVCTRLFICSPFPNIRNIRCMIISVLNNDIIKMFSGISALIAFNWIESYHIFRSFPSSVWHLLHQKSERSWLFNYLALVANTNLKHTHLWFLFTHTARQTFKYIFLLICKWNLVSGLAYLCKLFSIRIHWFLI